MHVTIDRAELVRAITSARSAVPNRSTIPILGNVKIYANGNGRLEITGTDLDRQCIDSGAATVVQPGAVTVPADLLAQISKALPSGTVSLVHDPSNNRIDVSCGRARYKLATLSAEDFPDITGSDGIRIELPAADAARLLSDTLLAASTESTRMYLCGCYLHTPTDKPLLRSVATDGHRLFSVETALPAGVAPVPGVIVPRQAMADIGRMCEGHTGSIAIVVSGTRLAVEAGGIRYLSKLIDGTFPDYQRVIPPSGQPHAVTVRRADLEQATSRMLAVLDSKFPVMAMDWGGSTLAMAAMRDNTHEASDAIDAEVEGPAFRTGISARYLLDQLAAMRGDTVGIECQAPGSPMRLTDHGHETDVHVIMPMRV